MDSIDRRGLLTLMLGAAAAATIGPGLDVQVAEAGPLPLGAGRSEEIDDVVQQAQGRGRPERGWDSGPRRRWGWDSGPRRRWGWGFGPRRRWDCVWRGGRRVCGWRW
jgi:hypothetical protein